MHAVHPNFTLKLLKIACQYINNNNTYYLYNTTVYQFIV
jgi:hypothetical protein